MKDRVPQIDLLFVDGDRSYGSTLADLQNYVPKLRPGGLLAMHDYTYDSVQRAAVDYFHGRLSPTWASRTHCNRFAWRESDGDRSLVSLEGRVLRGLTPLVK